MRSPTERTNAKFALTANADGVGGGEGAAVVVVRLPVRPPARPIGERAREGRFGEIGGFAAERATWAKSRDGTRTPSLGPSASASVGRAGNRHSSKGDLQQELSMRRVQ